MKWDLFLIHASQDKKHFVEPLAVGGAFDARKSDEFQRAKKSKPAPTRAGAAS
jgi:hypothetical protein